jgi:hypothetical protein
MLHCSYTHVTRKSGQHRNRLDEFVALPEQFLLGELEHRVSCRRLNLDEAILVDAVVALLLP